MPTKPTPITVGTRVALPGGDTGVVVKPDPLLPRVWSVLSDRAGIESSHGEDQITIIKVAP